MTKNDISNTIKNRRLFKSCVIFKTYVPIIHGFSSGFELHGHAQTHGCTHNSLEVVKSQEI